MIKNKKIAAIFICVLVNLAVLACNFPTINRFAGDVEETKAPLQDSEIPAALEPEETESPTQAKAATSTPVEVEQNPPQETQDYYDNGVQITLPGTFLLGDAEQGLADILDNLDSLGGEDADTMLSLFEQYQGDILLWAYDNHQGSAGEVHLAVMKNEQMAGMPLGLISIALNMMMGSEVQIVDQQQMRLDGREVLRIQIASDEVPVEGNQVIYLFNEASNLWIIGFFTNAAVDQAQVSLYDNAVASFEILEIE